MERRRSFKEWLELRETATSTGDIAGFRRITIPMVQRMWPPGWGEPDPFFSKKKKKKTYAEIKREWDKSDKGLSQNYHIHNQEVDALNWYYK